MAVNSIVPWSYWQKAASVLPLLSKTEWMLKYPKARPCNIFHRNNACPHGELCNYAHVYSGKYSTQPATAVTLLNNRSAMYEKAGLIELL
jgi:hypothetical protein